MALVCDVGTGGAARSVLQHFLDDFVSESLLPRVMADAKALTQSILSQKSAFLPSSNLVPDGGGAFVLQVAPRHCSCQHPHLKFMDHSPLCQTRTTLRIGPGSRLAVAICGSLLWYAHCRIILTVVVLILLVIDASFENTYHMFPEF